MRQKLEALFWVLVVAAILAIGLSDEVALAWITEHFLEICAVTLLLAVCGAISFLTGYAKGCRDGYADGFKIGVDWK